MMARTMQRRLSLRRGGWASVLVMGALVLACGWALPQVSVSSALLGCAVGMSVQRRAVLGTAAFRLADQITLLRSGILAVLVAMLLEHLPHMGLDWPMVALAGVMLALDAVDGQVARRTGHTSQAGARYDETVDAAAIFILSIAAAWLLGWWIALIGLMRFLFVAAALLRPRWSAELPQRRSRKVVAALQGALLVTAMSPLLSPAPALASALCGLALALLTWSFARDIMYLERRGSSASPRTH